MSDDRTIEQAGYVLNSITIIREHLLNQHAKCIADVHESSLLSGLSVPQVQAIHTIFRQGQVTLTQLARMQKVSPPSASAMVERLVEKGVLIREQDTEDRRKIIIRVSPEVSADFQELQASILRSFVDLMDKIGPEATTQWCEVLKKIQSALGLKGSNPLVF